MILSIVLGSNFLFVLISTSDLSRLIVCWCALFKNGVGVVFLCFYASFNVDKCFFVFFLNIFLGQCGGSLVKVLHPCISQWQRSCLIFKKVAAYKNNGKLYIAFNCHISYQISLNVLTISSSFMRYLVCLY